MLAEGEELGSNLLRVALRRPIFLFTTDKTERKERRKHIMMEKIKGVFTRNIEAEKRGIVEDQK